MNAGEGSPAWGERLRADSSSQSKISSRQKGALLTAEPLPVQPTNTDSQAITWHHCHLLTTVTHDSLCQLHTHELHTKLGGISFARDIQEHKGKRNNFIMLQGPCSSVLRKFKKKQKHTNIFNNLQTDLVYKLNGVQSLTWWELRHIQYVAVSYVELILFLIFNVMSPSFGGCFWKKAGDSNSWWRVTISFIWIRTSK